MRKNAMKGLIDNSELAIELIIKTLVNNSHKYVRQAVMEVLETIGEPAVAPLSEMLWNDNPTKFFQE